MVKFIETPEGDIIRADKITVVQMPVRHHNFVTVDMYVDGYKWVKSSFETEGEAKDFLVSVMNVLVEGGGCCQ